MQAPFPVQDLQDSPAKQRCPSVGWGDIMQSAYSVLPSVWATRGAHRGYVSSILSPSRTGLAALCWGCGLSTPLGGVPCVSSSPELRMMSFTGNPPGPAGFPREGREEGRAGPGFSPMAAPHWTAPEPSWSTQRLCNSFPIPKL